MVRSEMHWRKLFPPAQGLRILRFLTLERRIYETYFVLERVCHTVFIKTRLYLTFLKLDQNFSRVINA
jgi:hypothetical protein